MKAFTWFPFILTAVLAGPIKERQSSGPTVTISNGKVVGKSSLGVETFDGIPFAQPPVGQLRLKPPVPYTGQFPGGSLDATQTAKSCPQQSSPYTQPGFEGGSTSIYDGSQLVLTGTSGTAKGHPFIFVAVNYRISAFGFLAGKELQNEGSTNLGLRDQRLGLQWVADNIAAFGGDPTQVTIWGESAGAISVNDQLLINNGDNTYNGKPLFKAAIMNSGTIVPTNPVDTPKAQNVYNTVVAAAGCTNSSDTLACLRSVPYETFKAASDSLPAAGGYRSVDLAYLPRPDPSSAFFSTSPDAAVKAGKYAKVPMIVGDQEDEGPLFSLAQNNITTNDLLVQYLQSFFPTNGADLVPGLVATYPDDPAAGSPFRTGDLNNIYGQYKRLAAILGDFAFTLMRRAFLTLVDDSIPRWSFLDSKLYGTPILGTFHGTDALAAFYGVSPLHAVNFYRNSVISMVYYNNPNKIVNLHWPQWKSDETTGRRLINVQALLSKGIKDDFRSDSYEYLLNTLGQIRI